MASHEELSQWVLAYAKKINLQVTSLDWVDSYYKGFSDLIVKLEIGKETFRGRGTDLDPDVALMKGVTEAIERFICRKSKISSFGVAGHYDINSAKRNSALEYVERASINWHFCQGIRMKHLSTESVSIKTKDISDIKMKVHQFNIRTPSNLFGVFTLAEGITSGHEIGGIMGAAVCNDLRSALDKATIECFRNLAALSFRNRSSMTLEEFRMLEKPTSEDSQRLLFNRSYCMDLLEKISGRESERSFNISFENLNFVDLTHSELNNLNCPLKFVRCVDEHGKAAPDTEFVG